MSVGGGTGSYSMVEVEPTGATHYVFPKLEFIYNYTWLEDSWVNAVVETAVRKLTTRIVYLELQRVVLEHSVTKDEYVVFFHGMSPDNIVCEYVTMLEVADRGVSYCMWCGKSFPSDEACDRHEDECAA